MIGNRKGLAEAEWNPFGISIKYGNIELIVMEFKGVYIPLN
jgi:hypothetical protein